MTKAIILSAGQGRRLLPLTKSVPKAALLTGRQSILEWQLEELGKTQITEAVVITGFGADLIDQIADKQKYLHCRTLYNPFYSSCDNLGTCWVAKEEMSAPYLLINGDTLFQSTIVTRLLETPEVLPITLVTDTKTNYDEDDMKVLTNGKRLSRVGKRLEIDDSQINGESIGMMRFNEEGANLFKNKLDFMMRYRSGSNQWYLAAIDELAKEGKVAICPVGGATWCEVDHADDLTAAKQIVSSWDR